MSHDVTQFYVECHYVRIVLEQLDDMTDDPDSIRQQIKDPSKCVCMCTVCACVQSWDNALQI